MSWVIRSTWVSPLRGIEHHYFTGAGFSTDKRSAVVFGHKTWAEGTMLVLRRNSSYALRSKVVRRRRVKHRCQCVCCPCLARG